MFLHEYTVGERWTTAAIGPVKTASHGPSSPRRAGRCTRV